MKFNDKLFRQILNTIETSQTFISDGIEDFLDLEVECGQTITNVVKLYTKQGYSVDDIKYCLTILEKLGYIQICDSKIEITVEGRRFILRILHNIV